MDIVPAFGWARNLRLANDSVELIVTLEVGPRILGYRRLDGPNVLKTFDAHLGGTNEPEWMSRGGHRLWVSPEHPDLTYFPDNTAVEVETPRPGTVLLVSPPEVGPGFQKEIEITLDAEGTGVHLRHRVRNLGRDARTFAAWALTVMAPGGVAVLPLGPKRPHPGHPSNARSADDFAPDNALVVWPFTDLTDDRWTLGRSAITLRQDPSRGPTKIGLAHRGGAVGYLNEGTLFVKRFPAADGLRIYPDRGCNFETFTNEEMLELETLSPLVSVPPGGMIELIERWELHEGLQAFDLLDGPAIAEMVRPFLDAGIRL